VSGPTSYGKGDRPRPVNRKLFDENWERIWPSHLKKKCGFTNGSSTPSGVEDSLNQSPANDADEK
jgi:hypothetical protein